MSKLVKNKINKNIVKLTESELKQIIAESVKKVLSENITNDETLEKLKQISLRIFKYTPNDELEKVEPNPWYCAMGDRHEWAKVYSWSPEEGFKDITWSDNIPNIEKRVSPARGYEMGYVPSFTISELRQTLPSGYYLVLLHEESGDWEDMTWEETYGRVIAVE